MKIAVCVSGQLRDGDMTCLPSWKKFLLDVYDCDIFISSWNVAEMIDNKFQSQFYSIGDDTVEHRIKMAYQPKRCLIEYGKPEWLADLERKTRGLKLTQGTSLSSALAMYKKIECSHNLMKEYVAHTNTVYDVEIRIRFDVELISDIVAVVIDDVVSGKVVVKSKPFGTCDILYLGRVDKMTPMSELYSRNTMSIDDMSKLYNAEAILTNYVKNASIPTIDRQDISFYLNNPRWRYLF